MFVNICIFIFVICVEQKMYKDFELHGVPPKVLISKTYDNVKHRLQVEEATASVTNQMVIHNGSMSQDDEDDDDN